MVYLSCKTETSIERIAQRNRPSELTAPLRYWFDLNNLYKEWYTEYDDSYKIKIDMDNLDIIHNEDHISYVRDNIMDSL